jgi:hypothetical protein
VPNPRDAHRREVGRAAYFRSGLADLFAALRSDNVRPIDFGRLRLRSQHSVTSTLTWVDHDSEARDRSLRILALFHERESRDELGLGAVRDSIADQLFPGTSTIQTRLRYMLFVPWIYRRLEQERLSADRFGAAAERMERALVAPLLASDDRAGVFGRLAGSNVQRLPSSVYWSGLGAWGIRVMSWSQEEYHRRIDLVHMAREERTARLSVTAMRGDDSDFPPTPAAITWHPKLPLAPVGFPDQVNFALTVEEAEFIQERISEAHPHSLLSDLALRGRHAEVDVPWMHPDLASFRPEHRRLLHHARLFSVLMHGAARLYNIALAEKRGWQERVEEHREAYRAWSQELDVPELGRWALNELWESVQAGGHSITTDTKRFVEQWRALATGSPARLSDDPDARKLIERRERKLKDGQSRFANLRALEQWGGASGIGRLSYRWPTVRGFLRDLQRTLSGVV